MSERQQLPLTELTAISPIDGRYRREVKDIVPFSSEMGLIQTRLEIEGRYLIALSEVGLVRKLTAHERETLLNLGPNLTLEQAGKVKAIEEETKHDVKAMERVFRDVVLGTSLEDVTEMIHFGLTSEDVNNLSYRLMFKRAVDKVVVPALDEVVDELADRARESKGVLMIARTHGQPAVPTTLGKEIAVFAVRLNRAVRKLQTIKLTGKLNGAVGNFNAHVLAAPDVDWIKFSQDFVKSLGLEPNLISTQINPYEDMIEAFQVVQRINGVMLDLDQDMWRYISDDWFTQEAKKGEVGSSTMPQKVNPISFENSEGNLKSANSEWAGMVEKLAVSRLQRDLSDSTTMRYVGETLAKGLLAYRRTLAGLRRTHPNAELMKTRLVENYVILTEGVQTLLRRAGTKDPYSMVATLSRGQRIGQDEWQKWIDNLDIQDDIKNTLRNLTPETYIGNAEKLTDMALEQITKSRKTK
jgi:adenylosuccinate lyase